MQYSPSTRLLAEAGGAMFLLAAVVGSGIMAESLAQHNDALVLLGNTLATGAMLTVLITVLGPLSGAHFNPAVTISFLLRKEISIPLAIGYLIAQGTGAVVGTWLAHAMFEIEILQFSTKSRTGIGQWLAEGVATFGLLATILGAFRVRPSAVAAMVGLYISAGYWFTASTSFANPAVTLARCLTNTFSGIAPLDVGIFVVAQVVGAVLAVGCFALLPSHRSQSSE